MSRFIVACCLPVLASSAGAQEPPKFYEVRQTWALPETDRLSLSIDAYGADVKIETGPAGMVEAVFHVPDTLHPPVFERYAYADSGDDGSFQFARPGDGPGAVKGELWEFRVPPETGFLGAIHAGFLDVALWSVHDLGTYFTADSADIILDMSSLASGKLGLSADARTGDIRLCVPKTASVFAVAECSLGVLTADGFADVDLEQYAIPEVDFRYRATQQGRKYAPPAPGGAEVSLLATADRGDVKLVLVDPAE